MPRRESHLENNRWVIVNPWEWPSSSLQTHDTNLWRTDAAAGTVVRINHTQKITQTCSPREIASAADLNRILNVELRRHTSGPRRPRDRDWVRRLSQQRRRFWHLGNPCEQMKYLKFRVKFAIVPVSAQFTIIPTTLSTISTRLMTYMYLKIILLIGCYVTLEKTMVGVAA